MSENYIFQKYNFLHVAITCYQMNRLRILVFKTNSLLQFSQCKFFMQILLKLGFPTKFQFHSNLDFVFIYFSCIATIGYHYDYLLSLKLQKLSLLY